MREDPILQASSCIPLLISLQLACLPAQHLLDIEHCLEMGPRARLIHNLSTSNHMAPLKTTKSLPVKAPA